MSLPRSSFRLLRPFVLALLVFSLGVAASAETQAKAEKQSAKKADKKADKKNAAVPKQAAGDSAAKPEADAANEDKDPWKALTWRLVGPYRGGRVLAVSGVVGDPNTFYFGSVGGGIWKSTDAGQNWTPIFDKEMKEKDASPSIGAIAVAPSDPNVIYAGTGEACIRGNIIGGNGVWKSTDAGKTWSFIGLADTHAIGRIAVDPKNPDHVLLAALGHPFGPNAERGIFLTNDGGKSWTKALYKDENTGGIDVVFDPTNPRIAFAALWQANRKPWTMESGGPGSGLYRSADGGATWKQVKGNGLPGGIWGRIGVAVATNDGNRVWALIEAEKGGLYRSDDGGEHWTLTTDDRRFRQRAWYYTHLFADPKNPDSVYILNTGMYRSSDAGKTWKPIRAPHGDMHGLWLDPKNPERMIESNDGGASVSLNYGESWSTEMNQPTAQFYHVTTDNRFPYWVYGSQQDNSSVAIASAADGGIGMRSFHEVGGGESGYVVPDPRDPNIVYAGSYGGDITQYDHRTDETREITPWPLNPIGSGAVDQKYRFQWTEPIAFSPHDPNTLYFAAQVLFKTTDQGQTWQVISPDLTRNDASKQQPSGGPITKDNTGVEVYDTIFSVVESPLQSGLIWVGSDDGLVHITQNGGKDWANVTPKGLPEWATVNMIEASARNAGTAYVAADIHRLDDFSPYAYKTTDFGKTWTKITNGIPADDYVHAVREDHTRAGLLYAATEKGVYVSWDDGGNWQAMQSNLPKSPVWDIVTHGNALVAATHGRSFWVLDDVSPLEQYQPQMANDEVHLFTPAAVNHTQFGGGFGGFYEHMAQNPPAGATIYYWLKDSLKKEGEKAEEKKDEASPQHMAGGTETEKPSPAAGAPGSAEPGKEVKETDEETAKKNPPVSIDILDASGKVIRHYPPKDAAEEGGDEGFGPGRHPEKIPAAAGLNRFIWDLHYEPATRIPHTPLWGGSTEGPEALPGKYTVKLTVNDKGNVQTQSAPIEVVADPRLKVSEADLQKQFDLLTKIRDRVSDAHNTIKQIRDLRDQINALDKRLKNDPRGKPVEAAGKQLDKKMTDVEEALVQTKSKSGQDVLNFPIRLNNQFVALQGAVASADAAPTAASYEVYDLLSKKLDEQMAKWNEIKSKDIPAYNQTVQQQNVPALMLMPVGEGAGK